MHSPAQLMFCYNGRIIIIVLIQKVTYLNMLNQLLILGLVFSLSTCTGIFTQSLEQNINCFVWLNFQHSNGLIYIIKFIKCLILIGS